MIAPRFMNMLQIAIFSGLLFPFFNTAQNKIPTDAIKGDFDGDGKPEYVWVIKPRINADNTDCVGGACVARLVFSNPRLKPIVLNNSIGGELSNLGNLNGDDKDVIGLLPDWFQGCWHNFLTYTLKNGQWQNLVSPFPTHCNQWEDKVKAIEKIPGKKGYLKIHYSTFEKNDIVVKAKIVKIL